MYEQYIGSTSYIEFPSFAVAVYSILLAVVLSTVLALTYRFTFHGENFPNNFFQAIVLSSTVSAMVMMAVGDNLAVGFGVLGAVSIIRFRTLMRNPRNIIFIFASLSVGIATGVFGYAIAISGTVIFCLVVILLYFSPYGREAEQKFEILFSVSDGLALEQFEQLMSSKGLKAVINRVRLPESGITRYTFLIGLKSSTDRDAFFQEIKSLQGLSDIRLEHKDSDEQL
jgi:uncharacterized membrane protein YhiD involved in acid resistance